MHIPTLDATHYSKSDDTVDCLPDPPKFCYAFHLSYAAGDNSGRSTTHVVEGTYRVILCSGAQLRSALCLEVIRPCEIFGSRKQENTS